MAGVPQAWRSPSSSAGLSVLAALLVWAIASPAGLPAELGAPATPAAVHDMSSMADHAAAAAAPAAATTVASAVAAAGGAKAATPVHVPFDASLPPLASGTEHHYTIRLADEVLDIADGVRFQGWTFEGAAPGPVIHVREGDWVDITLVNGGAIPHSIDFHAALTAPDKSFKTIPSGGSVHFRFRASTPGVFMYHCGTPPVLAHIANGMYGAIVVDPKEGMPPVDEELRARLGRVVPRRVTARRSRRLSISRRRVRCVPTGSPSTATRTSTRITR